MILEGHNDRRQIRQQGELMKQQIAGQMQLGDYNQQLAKEMWEYTNYPAQVEQLKKAGLNVGLLYKSAGAGGTTQGGSAGNVSGAQAQQNPGEIGMALQLGLQAKMQQAQIELTEAQTKKTQAETTKTAGVDTLEAGARIDKLIQDVQSAKATQTLTEVQTELAKLDQTLKGATLNSQIQIVNNAYRESEERVKQMQNQTDISNATKRDIIKQVGLATTEKILQNTLTTEQTKLTTAQINQVAAAITNMSVQQAQGWGQLNQDQQKIEIQKLLATQQGEKIAFETGSAAQAERVSRIISNTVGAYANYLKGVGSIIPF